MIKIKNLKTEKTEQQYDNEWRSVNGQKNLLLSYTDWTQLPDVPLVNREEFTKWRKSLRKVDMRDTFDSPDQALEFLGKYEDRLPKPELDFSLPSETSIVSEPCTREDPRFKELAETLDSLAEQFTGSQSKTGEIYDDSMLNKKFDQLEEKLSSLESHLLTQEKTNFEVITKEDAYEIVKKHLVELELINFVDRILDFPILVGQVEQALDFLSDSSANIHDYYLLENTEEGLDDRQYAHSIIKKYKSFLKEQKEIKKHFHEQITRVYNMATKELNDFFKSHGYRYRCSNEDKGD